MRNDLSNFIENYSIQNYNKDYNVKLDLTYKYPIKHNSVWRKWVGNLKKYMNKNDIFCDGFVISEYDRNISSLHNHILMYCDTDYYKCESVIFNYWNKLGSLNIEKYDKNLGYSSYITKHINKTENNDWEFLSML